MTNITMERSTILNEKTHELSMAIFNSKLFVYQSVQKQTKQVCETYLVTHMRTMVLEDLAKKLGNVWGKCRHIFYTWSIYELHWLVRDSSIGFLSSPIYWGSRIPYNHQPAQLDRITTV